MQTSQQDLFKQIEALDKAGTSQDKIQHFVNQYKPSQTNIGYYDFTPAQADHGFLGNLAAGAVKPFARLGTNLVQAGEAALGKPATQPFSGNFLGDVQPVGMANDGGLSSQNLKDAVGTGLEVSSYLPIGGGLGEVAGAGFKGVAVKGLVQGAKAGATAGALQGAGGALQNNEEIGGTIGNTLQGGIAGGLLGGAIGGATGLAGKAINRVSPSGRLVAQAGKEAETYNKIADVISPNATSKEAKLAQREGRFVDAKDPTFFRSGQSERIFPSKKTLDSTNTIIRNIPDAIKMKPSELYTAVDKKITDTANNLRPLMETTPVKTETAQKMTADWEKLKKTQMETAPATEEPNVLKRQAKFEAIVQKSLQKSEIPNHSNLWDTRIEYDNSISDAVKKATTESSESLQLQKDEWLQNRAILNNAIHDTSQNITNTSHPLLQKIDKEINKLNPNARTISAENKAKLVKLFGQKELLKKQLQADSKKAFSDMTNLYEAKTNLQSKAKLNTEPGHSKLYQKLTGKTAKTIGAVGAIGTGLYGIKKVAEAATK